MSGATVIDGDIYTKARARIAVVIGGLMVQKNLPLCIPYCEGVAGTIVELLNIAELFTVAYGTPSNELDARMRWSANNLLDWNASRMVIDSVARATGMGALPDEQVDRLVGQLLDAARGDNEIGAPSVIWASQDKVGELARDWFGTLPPSEPDELDGFMTRLIAEGSLMAPLADAAIGTRVRKWAREYFACEVSLMMKQKNIAEDGNNGETIAAKLVDTFNPAELVALISGAPLPGTMQCLLSAIETELDFSTAVDTVRAYADAAGVSNAPDAYVADIAARMIRRRKGDRTPQKVTLKWPSPEWVRQQAAQEFEGACRARDIFEIEQVLAKNRKLFEPCTPSERAETR